MKNTTTNGWIIVICLLLASCSKTSAPDKPAGDKEISRFAFNISNNTLLAQDIECEISGDTIYAVLFSGTDRTSLKPSFTFTGHSITVGGKEQSSGESSPDFAAPVSYTVQAQNGTTRQYFVKFTDTGLPTLYISTNLVPIESKEVYIPGTLQIKRNLAGDSVFGGVMEIRGRGNSTWSMPKKPFKIKLDKKAGLLGMKESKQWVLLANYADKSLLRNEVAFELSRGLGLGFTPAGRFVDVILNGRYNGTYELVEQVDIGKNKVNISEQDAGTTTLPGISGGYLLEFDGFAGSEAVHVNTGRGMQVTVHYPDDDDINQAQQNYISTYFNNVESMLFSPAFDDPANGYKQFFDIESYINFYLVNEITGNPDIFWSTYMYKTANNDTIYTGPVWDFDIASNNDDRLGDAVNKLMLDAAHEPKQWINRLMEDKAFRNRVRARWNEVKTTKVAGIQAVIDQLAGTVSRSQKKNFLKWPILSEKVYLNLQAAGSYAGEVNYLKAYFSNRISWLDTQFNGPRFD
jgi:hypothetical protein